MEVVALQTKQIKAQKKFFQKIQNKIFFFGNFNFKTIFISGSLPFLRNTLNSTCS